MSWYPHVTVAAVVERNQRFLMVRERTEAGLVYNQPAGHLEEDESLLQAVIRETMEETGWQITPTSVLNVRLYTAPSNGVTYLRTCFAAKALAHYPESPLDDGIEEAVWLSEDEIRQRSAELRSPLVWQAIQDYRHGSRFSLDLLGT